MNVAAKGGDMEKQAGLQDVVWYLKSVGADENPNPSETSTPVHSSSNSQISDHEPAQIRDLEDDTNSIPSKGAKIGTLTILVDRAKDLPNAGAPDNREPKAFCVLTLGLDHNLRQTEQDNYGGTTPVWYRI